VRAGGAGEAFAVDVFGNLAKTSRATDGTWTPWVAIATGIDACTAEAPMASDGGAASDAAQPHDARAFDAAAPRLVLYDAGPPLNLPPPQVNGETATRWWGSQGPTQMGSSPSGCAAATPGSRGSKIGISLAALLAVLWRRRRA
jgi:hypothetical protein